jgi:two-component sensor histidine kinase
MLIALIPITLISIVQGMVRLENARAPVVRQLSTSAAILASSNKTILDNTTTLLRVMSLSADVASKRNCGDFLAKSRSLAPSNANLVRYDANGGLVCAAIAPAGQSVAEKPWWKLVDRATTPTISGAYVDPVLRRLVVDLAVPLRDESDNFDGALVASIDLDRLISPLRQLLAGADSGIALLDTSGTMMLADRRLPHFDPATPPGTIMRVRDDSGVTWSYVLVPLVQAGLGQRALNVVYATPEVKLLGLAEWQSLIDFTLPVLASILASLAIWIGAERLVLRWLRSLQKLALQFAGGDYRRSPTSFLRAPSEMRSMAAALYRMSIAVEERDRSLRLALERQKLLAREVHHRVKNNLQLMMSLLSLQSSRLDDETARDAIDQARLRVGALATVHRQLYDADDLGAVASAPLLKELCDQLQYRSSGSDLPDIIGDFDDVPLGIDTAVPVALWLIEAINGALDRGAGSRGAIHVRFHTDNGVASLLVLDAAPCVSAEAANPSDHGLRLINAFAAQLGGEARVEPGAGGGCESQLDFPLNRVMATS